MRSLYEKLSVHTNRHDDVMALFHNGKKQQKGASVATKQLTKQWQDDTQGAALFTDSAPEFQSHLLRAASQPLSSQSCHPPKIHTLFLV